MAGIFANVDSDIKKLQRLREEIDNIKKALKGINVKVDIDIAQGLEAQLKSLTTQYDALVRKVSEAQGKITSSVNQINNASEKIIKAQERLTQASGMGNAQSTIGKSNDTSTQAETLSVEAQAKAYEELEKEINAILGTRDANIKRLVEEQNAIRLINEELKKLQKAQTSSSSSAVQNRIVQLNDSLLTHKTALAEIRKELSNNAKLDNTAATSMNALSQSLSRMRIAYRELTEEERNSSFGRQLLASIQQADAKIKELDATIGNHQRNLGNYSSGWNGLNMSIQQLGRELPSLAMGWNTFFLAISNNLPILADEIKRARTEYDAMKKSGQTAIPVWKQIASSLLSWQTALTVGITLLTLYGEEIVNWVSGLFGADSAQKKINESVKEFNRTMQQGQTEAKLLFDAVKQTEEGTQGRAEAIRKINSEYGKYLPNLLSERSSLNELEEAYRTVTEAIKEHAAAKMQSQAIEEIAGESIKKQADALTKMRDLSKGVLGQEKSASAIDIVQSLTEDFRKAGSSIEKAWQGVSAKLQYEFGAKTLPSSFYETLEDYVKSVYNSNKEIEAIQERYNPFFNKKKADEAIIQNKTYWEEVKRQAQSVLDSIESSTLKKLTEGNITGIPEEIVRKYKQAQEDIQKSNKELSAYGSSSGQNKQNNAITAQLTRISSLEKRQAQERIRRQIDLENQVAQSRIDAMADGEEKLIAQRELDNKKELETIERQKEEYKQKVIQAEKEIFDAQEELKSKLDPNYKKKSFDSSSIQVDTSMFDTLSGLTRQRQYDDILKAERDAMNTYLKEYGTFQQKKEAIAKEYAQKIANAETEGEKLSLGKERDKELTDLEIKAGDTTNAIIALFGDMSDKSLKELEELVSKGQEALEFIKNGQWDATTGARLGITEDEFRRWQESPELIKQAGDALKEVKNQSDELQPAFVLITRGFQNFVNAGSDSSLVVKALAEIQYGLDKLNPAINLLSGSFSKLGDSFGGVFSGIADGLNIAMDAVNSAMQGAQAGAMFGGIGAAAGAAIGVVTSLASAIAKIHDKKNEKRIQKLQDQIDLLDASYDKLGRSIEQAYSTDASNLIEQQNKVLEQQKVLIQQQIREEEDKKKTDEERIKQWEQQIADIDAAIADNTEKAQEAITGISFDTFRNNFLDTLMDMDSSVEDFADDFEQYLQRAILDSLITNKYKDKIEQLYNQWAELGENGLSESEVEDMKKYYNDFVEQMIKDRDQLADIFGWKNDLAESGQQQASAGGFETMSQDSADELNGRFTALQMSGETIASLTQQQLDVLNKIYTSMGGEIVASHETLRENYKQQALQVNVDMQPVTNAVNEVKGIMDEMLSRQAADSMDRQNMAENLNTLVKPIQQAQRDIAEVKQNTSRI